MRFQRLRHPVFSYRRARVLPRWVRRIDSRVGRTVNGRHAHPEFDRALRRLSRSADRGRLWFALAGVLLLRGDSRAAARGIASLLTASIIANLVGKKLFGGPRPLLKDVPVGRRLAKYPTSASF
ncbi:MAG: phosphoesterase, partial [Naasia sp.]